MIKSLGAKCSEYNKLVMTSSRILKYETASHRKEIGFGEELEMLEG
jgi:hypothetical protein